MHAKMPVMYLQESSSVTNVGATMLYEALAPQYPTLVTICLAVETPQKLVVEVIGSMFIALQPRRPQPLLLRLLVFLRYLPELACPLSLLTAILIQDLTVRLDSLEIFQEQRKRV